jgi:hypothetical protein
LGAVVVVAQVGGAAFGGQFLPGQGAVGVDGGVDAFAEAGQVVGVQDAGVFE